MQRLHFPLEANITHAITVVRFEMRFGPPGWLSIPRMGETLKPKLSGKLCFRMMAFLKNSSMICTIPFVLVTRDRNAYKGKARLLLQQGRLAFSIQGRDIHREPLILWVSSISFS
jgi:hypothetical protein